MRWVLKSTLDGAYCQDVFCDGTPLIPEAGAQVMLPQEDDVFKPGIVSEIFVDKETEPGVIKVICTAPKSYADH
jgi:hypothetical protein